MLNNYTKPAANEALNNRLERDKEADIKTGAELTLQFLRDLEKLHPVAERVTILQIINRL